MAVPEPYAYDLFNYQATVPSMANNEPSAPTGRHGDRLIPDDAPGIAAVEPERQVDYFISRRGASAIVAQEVADVLRAADYSVLVQDHDIPTGANFVLAMHDALKRCRHFVALLSKDYDSAPFTLDEWTNFYAIAAQSGGDRRFILLRIEDCNPQGLFSAVVFGDLVGID